jgi:hypothetical protein
MSEFKVKLTNLVFGKLDPSVVSGESDQRTITLSGPDGVGGTFNDGDTFIGSNYWKRFTSSSLSADEAFLTVETDDGSVYPDGKKLYGDVWTLSGEGAPVDGPEGGTGYGQAGAGSTFVDTTSGDLYVNSGTKSDPTWTLVGLQT